MTQQAYGGGITVLERRHEVWHQEDAGDWALAYFDVELPSGYNRWSQDPVEASKRLSNWVNGPVKAAFESTVKKWAVMREAEHEEPSTKPILNPGIFMVPEAGKQDYRRFYMAARFKRTKPKLVPIDTIAELAKDGPADTDALFRDFFEQMHGFKEGVVNAAHLEMQAQDNATLPERAAREDREVKRLEERLTHRITL